MKPGKYQTPLSPPVGVVEFVIRIPSGPVYAGALRGFLLDICKAESWEQSSGGMTPCDAAAYAEIMLSSFEEKTPC